MVEDPHDNHRSDCHEMDEERSQQAIQGNIISTTTGDASSTITDPVRLTATQICAGRVSVLGVGVPLTINCYCSWICRGCYVVIIIVIKITEAVHNHVNSYNDVSGGERGGKGFLASNVIAVNLSIQY